MSTPVAADQAVTELPAEAKAAIRSVVMASEAGLRLVMMCGTAEAGKILFKATGLDAYITRDLRASALHVREQMPTTMLLIVANQISNKASVAGAKRTAEAVDGALLIPITGTIEEIHTANGGNTILAMVCQAIERKLNEQMAPGRRVH